MQPGVREQHRPTTHLELPHGQREIDIAVVMVHNVVFELSYVQPDLRGQSRRGNSVKVLDANLLLPKPPSKLAVTLNRTVRVRATAKRDGEVLEPVLELTRGNLEARRRSVGVDDDAKEL